MAVTKVVGFDLRIPKHFSLHFYDFYTILYGIYNFAVFENKRKRKGNLASRPLNFYFFSARVPGRVKNRGARAWLFPARRGSGGGGPTREKQEGTEDYL